MSDKYLNVIGDCPPVVVIWYEYPCPTVPEESVDGDVMIKGLHAAGLIVIEKFPCTLCAPAAQLSVALIANVAVPADDGMPLISPVALIFSPAGNEPETILKLTGDCPPEVVS
jgi:hypothetical protein